MAFNFCSLLFHFWLLELTRKVSAVASLRQALYFGILISYFDKEIQRVSLRVKKTYFPEFSTEDIFLRWPVFGWRWKLGKEAPLWGAMCN